MSPGNCFGHSISCAGRRAIPDSERFPADRCFHLPAGTALGSKSAELVVDKLGTCAPSGGELLGAIEPLVPVTLCCQPETDLQLGQRSEAEAHAARLVA